jgi:hypothetical protein
LISGKSKKRMPPAAVSELARDRAAPMVSLKAKKRKKTSRGK